MSASRPTILASCVKWWVSAIRTRYLTQLVRLWNGWAQLAAGGVEVETSGSGLNWRRGGELREGGELPALAAKGSQSALPLKREGTFGTLLRDSASRPSGLLQFSLWIRNLEVGGIPLDTARLHGDEVEGTAANPQPSRVTPAPLVQCLLLGTFRGQTD